VTLGFFTGTIRADAVEFQAVGTNLIVTDLLYLFLKFRHAVHVQIFNGAAILADEMVMAICIGVKARVIAAVGQL
jgi:hypothetical protein